ncbi:MAG: hypothetical protein FJ213_07000 [Ignavibacteria bacterium]|nr:hypothetical protein [Ignavibacteria bacterium]
MPNEEDFAGEPIHVKLSQKIEANSFQRLSDLTLSSTPSKKVKVITEYLEKLKKLNFQKSLTHVFNEQINNVTFSIVYYQFETESNAVAATDVLIEMLSESMDQNFKYMTKEKPFGANQKIMYTSYMTYQVFVGLYTRNNILCLTFVPYKSVFPRVIPVSTKKFKYDERYESYSGLPAFARLDNDKIIKLIKEIESNAKIDSSEKSKKFEVLFKLVLDFHKSNSENNERIVNTFLDQCQRKNLDEALRYVDLRITRDLSSQLLPSWYATKIEKVFGSSCEINLDPNSAAAHIQNNFSYDNIFGDKKPFLGLVEVKGILSGTKKAGDVKIIFSLFGDYVKLVDFKFN